MTPLDTAAYRVLEDLVLDSLLGSFHAAALVLGQLYVDVPRTNFWATLL